YSTRERLLAMHSSIRDAPQAIFGVTPREKHQMVTMVLNLEVADYDEWKKLFDSDPGGRKGIATGHIVSRNVENPNAVFIRTEYASVDDAKKVRQQLLDSGALKNSTVKPPPTIIETADQVTY